MSAFSMSELTVDALNNIGCSKPISEQPVDIQFVEGKRFLQPLSWLTA